ncbi:MAG: chitobiase/beta-hexosaminidase C-terminal domain-containing protein [Nitrospinae bacterium]|nr:chitobiase/beta-hexosaminidase C-terminal domain-containing protein [Nitrospinota bacterium]
MQVGLGVGQLLVLTQDDINGVSYLYPISIADTTAPTTTASPSGGTYTSSLWVRLTCSDTGGCSKTYYTTNGSEPTTYSSVYYSAIYIDSSISTLKFFSVDNAGNQESVKTETYTITIDSAAPTTTASPPGGVYYSPQRISLSCSDDVSACAGTYYWLKGNGGASSGSTTLSVSSSPTLRYHSADNAGNQETDKVEVYKILYIAGEWRGKLKGDLKTDMTLKIKQKEKTFDGKGWMGAAERGTVAGSVNAKGNVRGTYKSDNGCNLFRFAGDISGERIIISGSGKYKCGSSPYSYTISGTMKR